MAHFELRFCLQIDKNKIQYAVTLFLYNLLPVKTNEREACTGQQLLGNSSVCGLCVWICAQDVWGRGVTVQRSLPAGQCPGFCSPVLGAGMLLQLLCTACW